MEAIIEPLAVTCIAVGIVASTPAGGPIWIQLVAEATGIVFSGVSATSSVAGSK